VNKSLLKEKCVAIIQERMDGLQKAMKESQDAANNETKSSSGDKYETTRAMNQLEKDMYARQLVENTRELSAIMETDCEQVYAVAGPGSYVRCPSGNFFVLAGLGKISFDGTELYVISPNAPLARSMSGKGKGDSFIFNNKEMVIEKIW
jgi:transcription elongation GreA/GreB family factor